MTFPEFDPARRIAVIGFGVMGAKVAWACSRAGIPTCAFDTSADQLRKSLALVRTWGTADEQAQVAANLTATESLDEALAGAQLAFENVPEIMDLKQRIHADIGRRLDSAAYMGSNTSSMLCSPLAEASGRPQRFFNMNFTDPRDQGLVEIMGSRKTAPETLTFALAWASAIRMVPLVTKKEIMGYSFNRLWRAIKKEVLHQVDKGYGDPESIDRAWMLTFGTPYGPFGLMDQVGLKTILKVEEQYFIASGDESDRPPKLLHDMIAAGHTGVGAGRGFYTYPDPAYERPEWLKGG